MSWCGPEEHCGDQYLSGGVFVCVRACVRVSVRVCACPRKRVACALGLVGSRTRLIPEIEEEEELM